MRPTVQHHSASKYSNAPKSEMSARASLAGAFTRRTRLVRLITSGERIPGRGFKSQLY